MPLLVEKIWLPVMPAASAFSRRVNRDVVRCCSAVANPETLTGWTHVCFQSHRHSPRRDWFLTSPHLSALRKAKKICEHAFKRSSLARERTSTGRRSESSRRMMPVYTIKLRDGCPTSCRASFITGTYGRSLVSDAPDRAVAVFGNEQRPVVSNGYPDGTAPYFFIG